MLQARRYPVPATQLYSVRMVVSSAQSTPMLLVQVVPLQPAQAVTPQAAPGVTPPPAQAAAMALKPVVLVKIKAASIKLTPLITRHSLLIHNNSFYNQQTKNRLHLKLSRISLFILNKNSRPCSRQIKIKFSTNLAHSFSSKEMKNCIRPTNSGY